jgi:hypothetical protein
MSFLLLGVDSLIACLAIGPIISRRWRVPLAALFGVCDGAGFLLGSALHWSMPGTVSTVVGTAVFVALGVYWIVLGFASKKVAGTRWVWALPFALAIDNITFGVIDGHWTTNVWGQAGEQVLSSALLAALGIALSVIAAQRIPAVRRALERGRASALGFAGAALILAAGVELVIG